MAADATRRWSAPSPCNRRQALVPFCIVILGGILSSGISPKSLCAASSPRRADWVPALQADPAAATKELRTCSDSIGLQPAPCSRLDRWTPRYRSSRVDTQAPLGTTAIRTSACDARQEPFAPLGLLNRSLLGQAFHIGGAHVPVPGVGKQEEPAVAFNGADYLVVWEDLRRGLPRILGARVNQAGDVLAPGEIRICADGGAQISPAIAFDGRNYVVVWEDYRDRSTGPDVYATRVTQLGRVLDVEGIPVCARGYAQGQPAVASDGTGCLAVWTDYGRGLPTTDLTGARLSHGGEVLDADGLTISEAEGGQLVPALAFDGANYLVVWQDGRAYDSSGTDIYGCRVTREGRALDPEGLPLVVAAGDQINAAVSPDRQNSLVIWQEPRRG